MNHNEALIASRFFGTSNTYLTWSLRKISMSDYFPDALVTGAYMSYMTPSGYINSDHILNFYIPIIELNSNVMIDTSNPNADGETANTGWDLKFK